MRHPRQCELFSLAKDYGLTDLEFAERIRISLQLEGAHLCSQGEVRDRGLNAIFDLVGLTTISIKQSNQTISGNRIGAIQEEIEII